MPETALADTPTEMEPILARLVAAGIAQPEALATVLGVDLVDIGRPLRALLRVGIVAADASGTLRVSPRGEAWLRLPPAPEAPEPSESAIDLPALEPLPAALEPRARPSIASRPARAWRLPTVPLPRPRVPTLALDRRQLAVVGASALLVTLAGESGLYSFSHSRQEPALAAPVAPVPPVATPTPVAVPTPAAERWMVVQHTNGLGLVLRPAPASTARLVLLQEGARLRVTGGSIQQAGHAWLPVTSSNGTTGWVAGEFLAPAI